MDPFILPSDGAILKIRAFLRIFPSKTRSLETSIYMYMYLLEQCNLTGGRDNSLAISVFFISEASVTWKHSYEIFEFKAC